MIFEQNKSLLEFNTFHINVSTDYFVTIENELELISILNDEIVKKNPVYIIGGGSNILLTKDIKGLVILNKMKGIEIVYEDEEIVKVKFMGGENWHQCVMWCVDRNYGGIENLSLIPGTIGAAPIQNIGAYGVELKDVFVELEVLSNENKQIKVFSKDECDFGYRNSIFKMTERGKYIIVSVTLQLSKQPHVNTHYGNIKQELEMMGITSPTIKDVSNAVIQIRKSKLPDPEVVGNAGSFFKNPVIHPTAFEVIKRSYPDIPSYQTDEGIKIPAAWLIENCHPQNALSWKGYREKNYGVHNKQALCLVNYSNASGMEIFDLSSRIITSVQQAFNITLEREVNIW